MIVGAQLADWLGNSARQTATADAINRFRSSWEAQPAVRRLRWAAAGAAAEGPDALLACAGRFFEDADTVNGLLDGLVAAARSDPFFRPPLRLVSSPVHSGMLLFDSPAMMISLGIIPLERLAAKKSGPRGSTSIMFNGQRTLLRIVRSGGASFSFWEAPPTGAHLSTETAGRCRLVGRRPVVDGETILLDGSCQSFVIERATSDIVLLQANLAADGAPFLVEYDSRTLEFVGASSADEANSRLELMVSLLRLLDAREAIPIVRQSLSTGSFHTRWQIMRELLAWDPAAALPALREMAAADPHPEVRETARETIALFFDETREEAGAECLA